jgi:hypothetical protein
MFAAVTDWITAGAAVIAAGGTLWAAIAAWKSAKASERASRETADALVLQMEREQAIKADDALRALEVDAAGSDDWSLRLGAVHNRWQDDVAMPAMRLRDREIRRRVQLVGDVVFLAMQPRDEHVSYAFLAAVEDARAALTAFLQNEPLPPAHFPEKDALRELCPITRGGRSFEPLNEWLAANFPGFRQLT